MNKVDVDATAQPKRRFNLRCLFGRHKPDDTPVNVNISGQVEAVCAGCGLRIARIAKRGWVVIERDKRPILELPQCWRNRHRPISSRVTWDGAYYVGVCRHCGEPIRRERSKVWVKSD